MGRDNGYPIDPDWFDVFTCPLTAAVELALVLNNDDFFLSCQNSAFMARAAHGPVWSGLTEKSDQTRPDQTRPLVYGFFIFLYFLIENLR